ncbi:unnamed protein product [Amoebophrya sp. A25]|nr:unnamed protein product [Amoebophrya sp. A25]|eukprot:GSA25T00016011001.1
MVGSEDGGAANVAINPRGDHRERDPSRVKHHLQNNSKGIPSDEKGVVNIDTSGGADVPERQESSNGENINGGSKLDETRAVIYNVSARSGAASSAGYSEDPIASTSSRLEASESESGPLAVLSVFVRAPYVFLISMMNVGFGTSLAVILAYANVRIVKAGFGGEDAYVAYFAAVPVVVAIIFTFVTNFTPVGGNWIPAAVCSAAMVFVPHCLWLGIVTTPAEADSDTKQQSALAVGGASSALGGVPRAKDHGEAQEDETYPFPWFPPPLADFFTGSRSSSSSLQSNSKSSSPSSFASSTTTNYSALWLYVSQGIVRSIFESGNRAIFLEVFSGTPFVAAAFASIMVTHTLAVAGSLFFAAVHADRPLLVRDVLGSLTLVVGILCLPGYLVAKGCAAKDKARPRLPDGSFE